jgi:hypothetical protein
VPGAPKREIISASFAVAAIIQQETEINDIFGMDFIIIS